MNQNRFMMDGRLPPPRGSPGYMSRIYRSDLRPAVLFGAFLALLWMLISGISSFRNVPYFNSNRETNLGTLYIILGCLCMGVVAIEAFGIFAAASRKLGAVGTYAYLSILATLLIAATYIIQTIIHYRFKTDIITLCTDANSGDRIFFTGFFGPIDGGIVTPLEARTWCNREYDRDSFSYIVALLVVTAVAVLFALFVFAYLRQLRDPTSAANFSRVRVPDAYNAGQRYNQPSTDYHQYPPSNDLPPDSFVPPYKSDTTPPAYDGNLKDGFVDRKDHQPLADDYQWNGR